MADRSLFSRLGKLFSSDVIVRNVGGKKLKVSDTNHMQSMGGLETNFLIDRFTKLHSAAKPLGGQTGYGGSGFGRGVAGPYLASRMELLSDYDSMDTDPIIASALDIYADECCVRGENGRCLTIRSENERVESVLNNLFYDILNIEFNLWSWIRGMCKYGDTFLKLDISEKYGVVNIHPISTFEVLREEGFDPLNPSSVQFRVQNAAYIQSRVGPNAPVYQNYEVAHFRLLGDSNFLPYGRATIEPARKLWKQLCLHENTKIWMADGSYKLIKNINAGDIVISFDYKNNMFRPSVVKTSMKTGHEMTYEISTAHRKIRATADHKLMISDGRYKRVDELTCDDNLIGTKFENSDKFLSFNNDIKLEKIRSIKEYGIADVYDFEVDDDLHNFIADGVVSSNCLMEDAMLIHRIMRAPEKRIFKIDIGNIPPAQVDEYMRQVMDRMKKAPYVNPQTGDYNLKYNMMNITEDFYLPTRPGDTTTSIESLKGLEFNAIEDITYLREKLLSALKVPKAFLGFDEKLGGKATLAAEDVRFARTIERIQRIVESELYKIAIVHLYSQGFEDKDLVDFSLELTNPSTIYEQEKISLLKEKINIATELKDTNFLSTDWVYKTVFNMSDEDIDEQREKIADDARRRFKYRQMEDEGNDPEKTGRSFGTPHDLASMNILGREYSVKSNEKMVKPVDDDGHEIDYGATNIRRNEKGSFTKLGTTYGQDDHPRGRDPLGGDSYFNTIANTKLGVRPNYSNRSPFPMESFNSLIENLKNVKTKEILTESLNLDNNIKKEEPKMLDENNLIL